MLLSLLPKNVDYTQIEVSALGNRRSLLPSGLFLGLFFVDVIRQLGAAWLAIPCLGLAWFQRAARMALLGLKALQTSSRVSRYGPPIKSTQ